MNAIDDNHDNDDYLQGFYKELFKRDYFIRSLFVYLFVFLYQFHLFLYFLYVFTFEVPGTLYSIRTFSLIMSLTKSSNDLNPSFSEITIVAVLKFFDNLKTIGISISWSFQYHSCCFCNFYSLAFSSRRIFYLNCLQNMDNNIHFIPNPCTLSLCSNSYSSYYQYH
jgi:hypothetical protein